MEAKAIFPLFYLTITVELRNVKYGPIVIILIPLYLFFALLPLSGRVYVLVMTGKYSDTSPEVD